MFYRQIAPRSWGLICDLLGAISIFGREHSSEKSARAVYLLRTLEPEPTVTGPDITEGIRTWLSDVLDVKKVVEIVEFRELHDRKSAREPNVAVASYDWLVQFARLPLNSQVRIAFGFRQKGFVVWAMLPDIYWLRLSLASSILVSATKGFHLIAVNSREEAQKFGLVRTSSPHFYILPDLRIRGASLVRWEIRKNHAIGSASGEKRRVDVLNRLIPSFEARGFSWSWSHSGNVPYEDYIASLQTSKVAAVPTFLPISYLRGPARYQSRISKTMVTGRVWETFSAGCALLTNLNQNLEDFGFHAGVHYLLLPETGREDGWVIPDDETLREIASQGREKFLQLAWNETFPQSH